MKICGPCSEKSRVSIGLMTMDMKEVFPYYIGDTCLDVCVDVPKWECPRCGEKTESKDARILRNLALDEAIEMFWRGKFKGICNQEEVNAIKRIARKVVGQFDTRKRRVAEEFGRWLGSCIF